MADLKTKYMGLELRSPIIAKLRFNVRRGEDGRDGESGSGSRGVEIYFRGTD